MWQRGVPARGASLAPGTCIATFDASGRYANATDGSSHAAIVVAERADGIEVWDQWRGKLVGKRVIRFKGGAGPKADDGDQYFTIEREA